MNPLKSASVSSIAHDIRSVYQIHDQGQSLKKAIKVAVPFGKSLFILRVSQLEAKHKVFLVGS